MADLVVHTLTQPAVAVQDRALGVARMADLFAAVPADRRLDPRVARQRGTLFAFDNTTFLEVLDPVDSGHTRHRFVTRNGPGFYMISADLANDDVDAVGEELSQLGKRVVAGGPGHGNVRHSWHLDPRDCGRLLVMLAVKRDRRDNREWAGAFHHEDIVHNTRFIREIAGVIARTPDPQGESRTYSDLGMNMAPLDDGRGALGWRGPTGNVFEFWPADAWEGAPVGERRDYAICLRVHDVAMLKARMACWGLRFSDDVAGGRSISSIDPVLGVRFALESAWRGEVAEARLI